MKIIAIANEKGGVGKTTLAVNLAFFVAELGKRALVVDLDPQHNSSSTLEAYNSGVLASALFRPAPFSVTSDKAIVLLEADRTLADVDRAPMQVGEHLKEHLQRLSGDYDICIIDVAPAPGLRQLAALVAADFVVSPIELETYSVDGITAMLQTIFGVRSNFNPDLKFIGMLPNRFNSHSPAHKDNLKAILKAYSHLTLPMWIGLRTSIAEAITAKVPVWQLPKTSAREAGKEMRKVLATIIERMGGLERV